MTEPESQIAAQHTRQLWQRYRQVGDEIRVRTTAELVPEREQGRNVHEVLTLLFEQSVILDELLGGKEGVWTE